MNISFVNPSFLFALALIAIPIIVHLFNFRKFKKVLFTNVRFLNELKQETTSLSRLKHLLVLLSRILAVIFLVLAFAQPYIPAAEGLKLAANRVISIFIDNSFSMEAVTKEGTLLDVSKKAAREIASAYKPSDRFHLLTADFDPVHQRLISRDEFITAVDEVKISPVSRQASEILARQSDMLNQQTADFKSAILLSDFQETMANIKNAKVDSSIQVSLIPVVAGAVSNIMIDSVWLSTPVVQLLQSTELNVRIRNFGDMDVAAVPVKLSLNQIQKAVAGADVAADNYTDLKLTFTASDTGWNRGMVTIIDNPIIFDDDYYFSFYVAQQASLLSINKQIPGPYLKALFSPDGYFQLANSDEQQIDYGSLSSNKLIFINELRSVSTGLTAELKKYINNGGVLVVIPDSLIEFDSYANFLSALGIAPITSKVINKERVEKLLLEDPVYSGVFSSKNGINQDTDLPFAENYFLQTGKSESASEVLMRLRSGAPFLTRYRSGKGEVYLFAVPFTGNMSNFARHALFVPVIYRMALLSEKGGALAYSIGKDESFEIPAISVSGDHVFHLINKKIQFDAIPSHRSTGSGTIVSLGNQVVQSGNYELLAGSQIVALPSYNYNRSESVMKFMSGEELETEIADAQLNNFKVMDVNKVELANSFSVLSQGTPLWKYCIILVLIFLAIEILLLKFWKK